MDFSSSGAREKGDDDTKFKPDPLSRIPGTVHGDESDLWKEDWFILLLGSDIDIDVSVSCDEEWDTVDMVEGAFIFDVDVKLTLPSEDDGIDIPGGALTITAVEFHGSFVSSKSLLINFSESIDTPWPSFSFSCFS